MALLLQLLEQFCINFMERFFIHFYSKNHSGLPFPPLVWTPGIRFYIWVDWGAPYGRTVVTAWPNERSQRTRPFSNGDCFGNNSGYAHRSVGYAHRSVCPRCPSFPCGNIVMAPIRHVPVAKFFSVKSVTLEKTAFPLTHNSSRPPWSSHFEVKRWANSEFWS